MEFVSVIIPCFNEQKTIAALLESLRLQTYPLNDFEVIIADGLSTDDTRQVVLQYQSTHPEMTIRLIDNPPRNIPSALNRAISAAHGSIIVRLDAHSKPHNEYVARSIAALEEGLGQNVGGVWDIQPGSDKWISRSIAAAAGHPIGVGDARYRFTDQAGIVDTVPFGAFKRDLIDRIGFYDETLLANEDYEFNARVRESGGQVWLDPKIRSAYFARRDLKALSIQYWRYGYWKRQMLRRYPQTLRWRQALPPVFVFGLAVLLIASPFFWLARWALAGILALYAFILLLAGVQLAIRKKDATMVIGVPLAIATMHFSWGTGFLWSLLSPPKSQ